MRAKPPEETIEPIALVRPKKAPGPVERKNALGPKPETEPLVKNETQADEAQQENKGPASISEPDSIEVSGSEISLVLAPSMPPPPPRIIMPSEGLRTIGRDVYEVRNVFAEGGIGRILEARDVRLNRVVAIKELLPGEDAVAPRFVREAEITARLEHPSIVPVHEAGYWPSGEPFFAMKLVSGRALSDVMKEAKTLPERLALLPHLLAVADAIAYAHSQGIMHRDLKPANILVGQFGETVVIDWGLAKDLKEEENAVAPDKPALLRPKSAHLTMDGAIMGTPAYMPPEQAAAKPVDERADVYAIGALLYRLLAGVAPYEGPDGLDVVAKVIEGPPLPLESRQKGIPEDLCAIVRKAMARKKEDRYPSAQELAEDLRRFQTGQIVGAHHYTRRQLLLRFVKRSKAPLSVAAIALAFLLTLGGFSVKRIVEERNRAQESEVFAQQQKTEAEKQRAEAQDKQAEATRRADELTVVQARGLLDKDPNEAVAWLKTLSQGSPLWSSARTLCADAAARGIGRVFRAHSGGINTVVFSPDGTHVATASDDRTARIWNLENGTSQTLSGHEDEVWCAAYSPDGTKLATGGKDRSLRVWDIGSGKAQVLFGHTKWISSIRFSPDGKWLVSQGVDEGVLLWKVGEEKGEQIASSTGNELSRGAVFSPDSRFVAYVEKSKLQLRDLETGKTDSFSGQTSYATAIAFSADGKLLATGAANGDVQLWSTKSGLARDFRGHKAAISEIAFLPDQSAIVSSSKDHTLRIVDIKNGAGKEIGKYGGEIKAFEISRDGRWVAAVGQDRTVGVWDLRSGKGKTLGGFQDWLGFHGVAFSPDGNHLAAGGFDQTMRVWNLGGSVDRAIAEHEQSATMTVFLPDAERVLSASEDGSVLLTNIRGGPSTLLTRHEGKVLDLRVFPDSSKAVSAGEDGSVELIPLTGQPIQILRGHTGPVRRAAVSPDGTQICTGGADKKVLLWDVATGKSKLLYEHDKPVETIAFSPDGELVATGGGDNRVALYQIASGQTRFIEGYERGVKAVAFSPDGRILAMGSMDLTIRLWTVATGEMKVVPASGTGVTDIVFFPDGSRFASIGQEPSVRLWDTMTGAPHDVLRGHVGTVTHISISPDGKRLVSSSLDGTLRLWDLESRENRQLLGHQSGVTWVAFSSNGDRIVSTGQDKTVRLWGDDLPSGEPALREWMNKVTPERIDWDQRSEKTLQ